MVIDGAAWVATLPAFALLTALLLLPGWLVVRALGVRDLDALAVSPAVSAGLIAGATTLLQRLGIGWGWLPLLLTVGVAVGVAAAVAVGVARLAHRRGAGAPLADPGRTVRRRLLGRPQPHASGSIAVGLVAAVTMIVPAVSRPDELVDSPDAVYHLNRIRLFLDSGNFSIANDTFYPNGFHAWVATALQSGVAEIVAGTNVAAVVLAAVVWPLGCVALVRRVLGPSRLITYAAGFASVALVAFPTLLLGWGVLWPNLMGTALTPGVLALMVAAVRSRQVAPWLGFTAALPGLALVQPNALVAIGVFALPWLLAARLRAAALHHASRLRVTGELGAGAAALAVALYVAPLLSARLASTQSYVWKDHVGIWSAMVEVVGGGLLTGHVLWGPVLLLPLGIAWIVTRRASAVPVVAMWLVGLGLYVIAAVSTAPWTTLLTGYWYNDKVRLASLAAVPGVVLVAAAAPALQVPLRRMKALVRRPRVVATVAVLAIPVMTLGWGYGIRHDTVAGFYQPADPTHVIVDDRARADLARLAARIPAGDGVVGRPENGTPLMYALFGTNTLYRSIPIPTSGDAIVIGTGFAQMTTRPDVCEAMARHRVRWAIDSPHVYWVDRPERSSGLFDLARVNGVTPVASAGSYTLFAVTGCPR